jgi:MFS family permease
VIANLKSEKPGPARLFEWVIGSNRYSWLRDNFGLELAPGITWLNVNTKFFCAFIAVTMLAGASILQNYLLTEHLGIPRGQQGTVSGDISLWTEVVAILLFNPFGVLADRIGRRPVFIVGILTIGLGYGLAPFATTWLELLGFRLIFAVGMAATAGTIATLSNDYPAENSRGKLIAYTSMFNISATIFIGLFIARIPALMAERGYDPVQGGTTMYLFAAALCVFAAIAGQRGLKPGTPVAPRDRAPARVLFMSGLRAAKNPRIALAYAAAFAARSDLVIKGLFLFLWAIQDGIDQGIGAAAAMARYGVMLGIMQAVSMSVAPLFGWFIDRVNRVTAMIVALIFACVGYLSMGIITSPLDFAMLPYFIIIALGSGFMLKASLTLVGQEAPVKERGSIIAASSMWGAIGILIFTAGGGRLFDAWGPWAPFVIAGAYQVGLLGWAIGIRIWAPGQTVPGGRARKPAMSGQSA